MLETLPLLTTKRLSSIQNKLSKYTDKITETLKIITNKEEPFSLESYGLFESSDKHFVKIPTRLIMYVMPFLSESETKVMFYIMRQTLGWDKLWDRISISQFRFGKVDSDDNLIDAGTGLSQNAVCEGLILLEAKGLIYSYSHVRRGSEEKYYFLANTITKVVVEGLRSGNVKIKDLRSNPIEALYARLTNIPELPEELEDKTAITPVITNPPVVTVSTPKATEIKPEVQIVLSTPEGIEANVLAFHEEPNDAEDCVIHGIGDLTDEETKLQNHLTKILQVSDVPLRTIADAHNTFHPMYTYAIINYVRKVYGGCDALKDNFAKLLRERVGKEELPNVEAKFLRTGLSYEDKLFGFMTGEKPATGFFIDDRPLRERLVEMFDDEENVDDLLKEYKDHPEKIEYHLAAVSITNPDNPAGFFSTSLRKNFVYSGAQLVEINKILNARTDKSTAPVVDNSRYLKIWDIGEEFWNQSVDIVSRLIYKKIQASLTFMKINGITTPKEFISKVKFTQKFIDMKRSNMIQEKYPQILELVNNI